MINHLKEYSEIYLILGFIVLGIYLVECLVYLKTYKIELWKRNIKLRKK